MERIQPWVGVNGSILKDGAELARLEEWSFNVERPYVADEELASTITALLPGAAGGFVIHGGAPTALLNKIRGRQPVVLECNPGWGAIRVGIQVDEGTVNLLDEPNLVVEHFPFRVTDDVEVRVLIRPNPPP